MRLGNCGSESNTTASLSLGQSHIRWTLVESDTDGLQFSLENFTMAIALLFSGIEYDQNGVCRPSNSDNFFTATSTMRGTFNDSE